MDILSAWLHGFPYALPFLILLGAAFLINKNYRDSEKNDEGDSW